MAVGGIDLQHSHERKVVEDGPLAGKRSKTNSIAKSNKTESNKTESDKTESNKKKLDRTEREIVGDKGRRINSWFFTCLCFFFFG